MKDKRLWILLYILGLCTACGPLGLPAAEPSPTLIATQPSLATTTPVSTSLPVPTATPTQLLPPPTPIFEILVDNVAIGPQGQLYATGFGAYGNDLRNFAQWDDTNWIALGGGFQTAGNSLAVDSAGRFYVEIFTDSQQGMSNAIMRWKSVKWEAITGNFNIAVDALKAGRISSNIPVWALAVDGEDDLYAAGSFQYPSADHTAEWPMGYVAKWDQETWAVLGQGFDKVNIYALAVSASGQVYVSGEQPGTGFIAHWDGETWTQIGTSKLNSCLSITNLALEKAGGLYASCTGSEAGAFIFYWDGTDWITITDQLEGEAPYVADMAVNQNGQLYIGGSFDSVSGIPARNIASWDGNMWHALENGVNQPVNALAVAPNGELYAVGAFTKAGDLPVHYVARWDAETWHTPGP
jgi:trimeric autotransporter adhesin